MPWTMTREISWSSWNGHPQLHHPTLITGTAGYYYVMVWQEENETWTARLDSSRKYLKIFKQGFVTRDEAAEFLIAEHTKIVEKNDRRNAKRHERKKSKDT